MPNERDYLIQVAGQDHQLLLVCVVLLVLIFGAMLVTTAILIPKMVKRALSTGPNGDPQESVTYGQVCKAHEVMNIAGQKRAADIIEAIVHDFTLRFNAVDKQLEIFRRQGTNSQSILIDLRAFMKYGTPFKPPQKDESEE